LAVRVPPVADHIGARLGERERPDERGLAPPTRPAEQRPVNDPLAGDRVHLVVPQGELGLLLRRDERGAVVPAGLREVRRHPVEDVPPEGGKLPLELRATPRHDDPPTYAPLPPAAFPPGSGRRFPYRSRADGSPERPRPWSASSASANTMRSRARADGVAPNSATRSRSSPASDRFPDQ